MRNNMPHDPSLNAIITHSGPDPNGSLRDAHFLSDLRLQAALTLPTYRWAALTTPSSPTGPGADPARRADPYHLAEPGHGLGRPRPLRVGRAGERGPRAGRGADLRRSPRLGRRAHGGARRLLDHPAGGRPRLAGSLPSR